MTKLSAIKNDTVKMIIYQSFLFWSN